ncbi:YkvI family membrane protein [Bacillus norwichensis]|uniref:Transporter n=1 Tax=Bacillus norwichensis TaxID=2762217 RepID=A0ABR8VJ70_9BACI|nr:hypothetical protein [Bacillus norwichensis]MBD8004805.1 hypothetical protein [Bacillus norwichensis]
MSEKTINWKRVFILAGALCAYLIGSATATGQESMQFFTAHGYIGIASIIVTLLIFGWAASSLIVIGNETKNLEGNVYQYFLGKFFGKVFEWFVTLFLFALTVTLISGSGTIFADFYGVNKLVGAGVMVVLIYITVLLSLQKLVDILSFIAPILIIFTSIISIISIFNNLDNLFVAEQLMNEVKVVKAVDSWLLSGILYAALGITVAAPFLIKMGSTAQSRREALLGGLLGALIYSITISIISFALLINIKDIFDKETPLVYLAEGFHPIFGLVFSFILLAGIYTTGAPMFWYVCNSFGAERTTKYRVISLVLIFIAFLGGLFLPFGKLVGTIFPLTGVLGLILLIVMAYKQIRLKVKTKQLEKKAM